MEPTANAMPSATLGQYKGLPITRRVRPVTENLWSRSSGGLPGPTRRLPRWSSLPPAGCASRWILRAF